MRYLIIFSTKYGSVEKAANIIKEKLKGEVSMVNISREKAPDLRSYDTVIIGGSIYIGRIQKVIRKYVKTNLSSLLQKRIGLFICAAEPEPIRTQELTDAFPVELFKHAVVKDVLGYEYDFNKLSFLDKLILRKIKGVTNSKSNLSENTIEKFVKTISNS